MGESSPVGVQMTVQDSCVTSAFYFTVHSAIQHSAVTSSAARSIHGMRRGGERRDARERKSRNALNNREGKGRNGICDVKRALPVFLIVIQSQSRTFLVKGDISGSILAATFAFLCQYEGNVNRKIIS